MLQFKRYLHIFLFPFIILISGCKHKPDEVKQDYYPKIELQQGTNFIFENITMPINSIFRVSLKVESNNISKEKIKTLKTYRIYNSDTVLITDSILDTEHEIIELAYISSNHEITEKWMFVVYDASGKSANTEFLLTTSKYPPELHVIFEKDYIPVGSAIRLAIHAKSNATTSKSLSRLTVKRKAGSFTMIELDTTFVCYELSSFKEYVAQSGEGMEEWEITITDASGEVTSSMHEIFTVVLLTEEHYGEIWNKMSSNNNAWDLINNTGKLTSDPAGQKDMANLSDSISTFGPEYFLIEWSAQNNTLFKRANQLDYDNISLLEAIDAYTGGSVSVVPSPNATGLEMGDIYVAKLRDSETYAVIQIINVIVTNTDHMDKIEFRYKK